MPKTKRKPGRKPIPAELRAKKESIALYPSQASYVKSLMDDNPRLTFSGAIQMIIYEHQKQFGKNSE